MSGVGKHEQVDLIRDLVNSVQRFFVLFGCCAIQHNRRTCAPARACLHEDLAGGEKESERVRARERESERASEGARERERER